jgi:hypothetical protein
MNIEELIERLDDLSWQEQMHFEMSERNPQYALQTVTEIDRSIREIAGEITPVLLDQLERVDEYVAWALRLSPHVPGDNPSQRGQRYLNHPNNNVRYWAERIASAGANNA